MVLGWERVMFRHFSQTSRQAQHPAWLTPLEIAAMFTLISCGVCIEVLVVSFVMIKNHFLFKARGDLSSEIPANKDVEFPAKFCWSMCIHNIDNQKKLNRMRRNLLNCQYPPSLDSAPLLTQISSQKWIAWIIGPVETQWMWLKLELVGSFWR